MWNLILLILFIGTLSVILFSIFHKKENIILLSISGVTLIILLFCILYFISINTNSFIFTPSWDVNNMIHSVEQIGIKDAYRHKNKKLKNKIDVPLYYINLDISKERRHFMENQIKSLGINAKRIPGVPGNQLETKSDSRTSDKKDKKLIIPGYGEWQEIKYNILFDDLSHAELGCTLANFRAIKQAFDDGEEIILVIEDDVSFSLLPYWDNSLSCVAKNAPSDWEIIQLFTMVGDLETKTLEYRLHNSKDPKWSSIAYIINRRGMEKIFSKIFHNGIVTIGKVTPDVINGTADQFFYALATTYILKKPLVFPSAHILSSTIHTDHESTHIDRSKKVVELYQKYNTIFEYDEKQIKFSKSLCDMCDFLESLNIPYRLSCGTVLGAYRENGFISYDGDIDIEILRKDYKPELEKSNKDFRFVKKLGKIDYGYELNFRHRKTNTSVDIFLLYDEEDYRWFGTYYGRCDDAIRKVCRYKIPKNANNIDATTITFLGRDMPIPYDTESYLKAVYGPNWNIPKSYNYLDSLYSNNYGIIEEDFPKSKRIPKLEEKQRFPLWPRKIAEMKKPIIWLYWQNKTEKHKKPHYLDLCLDTVYKHCGESFEIIVLDDEKIPIYCRSVHPKFTNINPLGMRADYIRFCLLREYGGIWLDCDTVVQRDLSFIANSLKDHNFVVFEHGSGTCDISIGLIAGKKGNRYSEYMVKIFEKHPKYSKWTEKSFDIGWATTTNYARPFLKSLRNMYPNEIKFYPAEMVYPVDWKKSKDYYWNEGNINPNIFNLPAILLHNDMYTKEHKKMSKEDVLKINYRISSILNKALGLQSSKQMK